MAYVSKKYCLGIQWSLRGPWFSTIFWKLNCPNDFRNVTHVPDIYKAKFGNLTKLVDTVPKFSKQLIADSKFIRNMWKPIKVFLHVCTTGFVYYWRRRTGDFNGVPVMVNLDVNI